MAYWPFVMSIAGILTIAGTLAGNGAWRAPLIALFAYIATRIAVENIPSTETWDEISVCTIWLCASAFMMYHRAWVPGVLFTFSALTYPIFVIFGIHIGWLSLPNIIAEVFAGLALISIGGRISGVILSSSSGNSCRSDNWFLAHSLGLAKNPSNNS